MLHLHDHTPRDSPLLRERFAHPQDRRVGDFVRGGTADQIGYGVQRKGAGAEQVLPSFGEIAGMGLMGLGGLVAIIGGLLFVLVVIGAMRNPAQRRHRLLVARS